MCFVAKTRCDTNTIRITIICVGPYIFIITKPFWCSTMPRHKIDEKTEGTILCLLKSGSGVTQIQRRNNRDNVDVTRMTITNVINKHGKEQKIAIWNKKKHVVYRRYQKAIPDVVKKIRTMILKTNPDNKLDIVNKLGLSIVTINHVIKHPLICRVAKKAECSSPYSNQGWKTAENILEAVQDTQRRNWTKYITTDVAIFNLSRGYGKMRVYYVWECQQP